MESDRDNMTSYKSIHFTSGDFIQDYYSTCSQLFIKNKGITKNIQIEFLEDKPFNKDNIEVRYVLPFFSSVPSITESDVLLLWIESDRSAWTAKLIFLSVGLPTAERNNDISVKSFPGNMFRSQ